MKNKHDTWQDIIVVLCESSKENFMLTRHESFLQAAKINKKNLKVYSVFDFENETIRNQVLFMPYVTYKRIKPSNYYSIFKDNIISLTHGDEHLDTKTLWPLLCSNSGLYISYNDIISKPIKKWFSNAHVIPEGFSENHIPEKKWNNNGKIIYVGAPFKGRREIIDYLINHSYDVDIFGSKKWLDTELKEYYKGYIDNKDYYDTISKYKVLLALTSGDTAFDCHPNAKLGDSLSSKVISLTEIDDITVVEYPENIKSIMRFGSLSELLLKVEQIYSLEKLAYRKIVEKSISEASKLNISYENSYNELIILLKNKFNTIIKKKLFKSKENLEINFSFLMKILIKLKIIKLRKNELIMIIQNNERYINEFSSIVFFPLSFLLGSRYYSFGSISAIKFNSIKSKISLSLVRKKNKYYFLPDLKSIYFDFFTRNPF